MTIKATGYPLAWPMGWRRTKASQRKSDNFKRHRGRVTIAESVARVIDEFRVFGIRDWNIIISTNVELTLSGYPRSGAREPEDPGVAVYFMQGDKERCIATDRYDRVAGNLAAIAATIEAMRAIDRHGGAEIIDRAFTGFAALPSPDRHWSEVLGVDRNASRSAIDTSYRIRRGTAHPDKGGSSDEFDDVRRAYEQACMETPE